MAKPIQELFGDFINERRYAAKRSEVTLRGYESSFQLLRKIIPDLTIEMLSSDLITRYFKILGTRDRVVGRGKIKKGIKSSTVATYWSKLNQFFKWLVAKKYLAENPFASMDYPNPVYGNRAYLHKADVQKIFAAILAGAWGSLLVAKRNVAIFAVLLYCGLRKGELLGLQVTDVDLERHMLRVRAETSKSRRERLIALNSRASFALKDYMHERQRRTLTTPSLFVSSMEDSGLTEHGLKHLVEKLVAASGTKFHLHQFRHTFAVNLLNNEVNIAKIKQLLGHNDIRMTATYLRALPPKSMRADLEQVSMDSLLEQ